MIFKDLGINSLKDTVVTDKVVFLRCDFNVPIKDNEIIDDSRILYALETIKYLSKNGAKVVICTHIGRPKDGFEDDLSTKILADYLTNLVRCDVFYVNALAGEKVKKAINKMENGDILFLENCRFDKREEKFDLNFAQEFADFSNVYVNEAFSCSHRSHTSIIGVPILIDKAVAGFRFEEEVSFLTNVLNNNLNFKTLIIGGSKISTKIDVLKNLIPKMNNILIGGAMVNTFLARLNKKIGKSKFEKDYFYAIDEIERLVSSSNCNLIIPDSFQVGKDLTGKDSKIKNINEIEDDDIILDIDPNYIKEHFKKTISLSDLILWNGPLGMFEVEPYDASSIEMAKLISENKKCISVAGGGDVIAAINKSKKSKYFTFISTAGGAFLEFIAGKRLPGLEILKKLHKK